jgi:ectoine hydroxylase-related dioxygenase (phytanoyl-CoA dioxygenase family)
MPLNRSPLRAITQDDIDTYERDGAVLLRNVFDRDWIDMLLPIAMRVCRDKADFGLLPSYPGRYMARTIPEFRRLAFDSPGAEAACRVMRSREAHFFFDEMFAKGPRSEEKTIWHTDRMGWPVSGQMVPSLWMPLTPIVPENSLECIAGTHTQDVRYWLFSPNARKMIRPPDRASHPDCEPLRKDPSVRFLRWQMDPGDLLIVHPWTLHYSGGNPTDDWRVAVSVRVFGDDIRWDPRPDCVNLAGVSLDEMIAGERPSGPLCPLVWSEDGRRDDDSQYPRGFATRWSRARKDDINEYALFTRQFEASRREPASTGPGT